MDKYKLAIIEHERCRKEIVRLTGAIGDAANAWVEESNLHNTRSNYQGSFPSTTTCIERYWQNNKEETRV